MGAIDVTCAVILSDKRVLATQRAPDMPHPLKWEFPGGKVREGESLETCLVREIREELGVTAQILRPLKRVDHSYSASRIRLFPFVCEIRPGTIRLAEHARYRWVDCSGLPETDWLEADLAVVEQVRREICR